MTALREIQITQPVSAEALQGLASLKSLEKLSIENNSGGDKHLEAIASITGLRSLRFTGEKIIDAGLRHLAILKELRLLDLGGHARELTGSGFEALSPLTNLRTLDVTGSGLDDAGAQQIGRLIGLERLSLRDTWISGKGLAAVAGLRHLKVLNLRHCRRLQTEDLAPLAELSTLEYLNLSECRIREATLGSLVGILKRLRQLRRLNLDRNLSTNQELNAALPKVGVDTLDWEWRPLSDLN